MKSVICKFMYLFVAENEVQIFPDSYMPSKIQAVRADLTGAMGMGAVDRWNLNLEGEPVSMWYKKNTVGVHFEWWASYSSEESRWERAWYESVLPWEVVNNVDCKFDFYSFRSYAWTIQEWIISALKDEEFYASFRSKPVTVEQKLKSLRSIFEKDIERNFLSPKEEFPFNDDGTQKIINDWE